MSYATTMGLSHKHAHVELQSTTTFENAYYAAQVIGSNHSVLGVHHVPVCGHCDCIRGRYRGFHVNRSTRVQRDEEWKCLQCTLSCECHSEHSSGPPYSCAPRWLKVPVCMIMHCSSNNGPPRDREGGREGERERDRQRERERRCAIGNKGIVSRLCVPITQSSVLPYFLSCFLFALLFTFIRFFLAVRCFGIRAVVSSFHHVHFLTHLLVHVPRPFF